MFVTVHVPATKSLLTALYTCVQKRPDGGIQLTLKQIDDARMFTMNAPRTASSFIKRRCPSWPFSLQSLCLDALSYSIVPAVSVLPQTAEAEHQWSKPACRCQGTQYQSGHMPFDGDYQIAASAHALSSKPIA